VSSVGRNASSQVAVRCYSLALSFGMTILLARHLGVAGYGSFVVVLMLIGLGGLVADVGTQTVLIRSLAGDEEVDVRVAAGLRLALAALASLLALAVAAAVYGAQHRVVLGIAIALPTIVLNASAGTATALLQARLRLELAAAAEAATQTVSLALVALAVANGASFAGVVGVTVSVALVHAVLLWLLARRYASLVPRVDFARWRRLLRAALPVGGSVLVATVYFRVDALLLASLRGPVAAGLYGIAYRPVEALGGFPPLYVAALFPLLVLAAASRDEQRLTALVRRGARTLGIAALPVSAAGIVVAPFAVRILGGHGYAEAVTPLRILLAGLPLLALNGLCGAVIVALRRQRDALVLNGSLLAFNVALNFALVPSYGATGAATAATVSELLLLGAQLQLLRHAFGIRPLLRLAPARNG
jgi:O-antigen/teichoic acid export membrane protein